MRIPYLLKLFQFYLWIPGQARNDTRRIFFLNLVNVLIDDTPYCSNFICKTAHPMIILPQFVTVNKKIANTQ